MITAKDVYAPAIHCTDANTFGSNVRALHVAAALLIFDGAAAFIHMRLVFNDPYVNG